MRLNPASVWVVIVDTHFGSGTAMVFHNRAIDDDLEDDVELVLDVAVHGDMGADAAWSVVAFQFLYETKYRK